MFAPSFAISAELRENGSSLFHAASVEMTPLGLEGVLPIWLTHMVQQVGRQTLHEALPHLLASLYIPDNGAIKNWGPQMFSLYHAPKGLHDVASGVSQTHSGQFVTPAASRTQIVGGTSCVPGTVLNFVSRCIISLYPHNSLMK